MTRTIADLTLEYEERAAILEHDNGMSPEDAERQASAEIYDQLRAVGSRFNGIRAELLAAVRRVHDSPNVERTLADCQLLDRPAPMWGVGVVVADGELYRPADDGEEGSNALIAPAFDNHGLADLVAFGVRSRRMATRLGVATLLGVDAVEGARQADTPLAVFDNTAHWLQGSTRGAVVVDWGRAGSGLEGIARLRCSPRLASLLYDATRHCWPRPSIEYAVKVAHAA